MTHNLTLTDHQHRSVFSMENSERLSQNQMLALTIDGQSVRMEKITVDQTLQLRHSVLWPDMPLSQVCLPEDDMGIHLGAFSPHSVDPIAVISLFVEPLPIDKSTTSEGGPSAIKHEECSEHGVRFRKFACSPRYQGKGLGTHLLKYALSIARSELDAVVVWCDARTTSTEWYQKRGLLPFGETFFKGPVEYVRMKIYLPDAAEADFGSLPALEA